MASLFDDLFPPEGDVFHTPQEVRDNVSGWLANLAKGKDWTPDAYQELRVALVHAWDAAEESTPWWSSSDQRKATAMMDATRTTMARYAADPRFPGLAKLAGGVEQSAGEATKQAPREQTVTGQVTDAAAASAADLADPAGRRPYLLWGGLAAAVLVAAIVAIALLRR
jgi:hypothetical protein